MENKESIKEVSAYKSRKFILTLLGLFIISAMTLLGIVFPAILAFMPSFISGIIGVLSLYFIGNVVNKHVVGNIQNKENY